MVSVVMPAYNVEKYISKAIDSIISQTYRDWELIIVDDCSIDNTIAIVESYVKKYHNIRLIKRKVNSGGCRLPRFDGVLVAKGEFVCPIDSDDILEPKYLQKCVERQKATSVDIISNQLVFCDENGKERQYVIPNRSFDTQHVLYTHDAVKLTIGGWEISVSGMLVDRDLYHKYIRNNYNSEYNFGFVDEIDQRKLLLMTDKVAFSDAKYYYRQQPQSIVHRVSKKYYEVLVAEKLLFELVEQNYKSEKEIYNRVCNNYLSQLLICQRLFLERKKNYTKEEQEEIKGKIKGAFDFAKEKKMIATGFKQKISLLSYPIFVLISYIYVFYLSLK